MDSSGKDEPLLQPRQPRQPSRRSATPFAHCESASCTMSSFAGGWSGSGLPALLISCVLPELPVYAVESKSRKTAFLEKTARSLGLAAFRPITCNVHELSRSWCFDVDIVTAKAFKPLAEVGPIARRCLASRDARLIVPVSASQAAELGLAEEQLVRLGAEAWRGDAGGESGEADALACLASEAESQSGGSSFLYYSERLRPSHGRAQRKLLTLHAHPATS